MPFEDDELLDCFLNHPPLAAMQNPTTMQNMQQHQFEDLNLNQRRQLCGPLKHPVKNAEGVERKRINYNEVYDSYLIKGFKKVFL